MPVTSTSPKKSLQGEKMTDDYVKVELKSFQGMCKQIIDLKARCKELSDENIALRRELSERVLVEILTGGA